MRILTFNHHESYLCSLASVGHHFDVVVRYRDLSLAWNTSARPVPTNVKLVEFDAEIKKRLRQRYYDVVVLHTVKNLLWLFPFPDNRYVFIAHIPLFAYTFPLRLKSFVKRLIFAVFRGTRPTRLVAVSEFKRKSWGVVGTVINLTPERVGQGVVASGKGIAIVCNQLARRAEELGYDLIRDLQQQVPIRVIGNNPGVPESLKPKDFSDFQRLFADNSIYLYTIRQPFGDGYNTAMLEAMSLGMAIVTVPNPSSPIVHLENGLVGRDTSELGTHLKFLLENPGEVERLGKAARATVSREFSQESFQNGWARVLGEVSPELS